MAMARLTAEWDQTSLLAAILAEGNRDHKRRSRPYQPADFHPFRRRRTSGIPITRENIELLKALVPDAAGPGQKKGEQQP